MTELSFAAIEAAATRIAGQVRPVAVARADDLPGSGGSAARSRAELSPLAS